VKVCDINKTQKIVDLFAIPSDQRDIAWKKQFFEDVFDASFACGDPQVFHGPDGFPYFQLSTPEPYKAFDSFCICNLIELATDNGFGIAINPRPDGADWVFSYGDLLSYRLFGAFEVGQVQAGDSQTVIHKAAQVLVGAPSEAILPEYTRRILKMFIERNAGNKSPGVFLMNNPSDPIPQALVFSIYREDFQEEAQFQSVMRGLSWFLPRHYPPTSISREGSPISQFYPL
jgi:hypothetical protein